METNKKENKHMDSDKNRKIFRIIGSILVAFAIWFYVDTVKTAYVTTTVRDIPVEFASEETVLADNELMLLSGYDTTIDLQLKGPRKILWKLDKDEIRIVADTAGITDTGMQSLKYQVIYPDNVQPNQIQVEWASAYSVTVTVGELYTKKVPIHCDIQGEAAKGFQAEDVILDPAELVLRAQRDDLLNVSYAKVQMDISNADETVVKTLEFQLYDYNDIPVENENIRVATKLIQATVPVNMVKMVPLKVNFVEAEGSTMKQIDFSIDPTEVKLVGEKDTLDTIDKIVLDTIYLQDLEESQSLHYDIHLPEGVKIIDGPKEATVTIVTKNISEQTISVDQFQTTHVPEGYEAEVVTEGLDITVRGLSKEVEKLKSDDLQIIADLSDIKKEGSYTVPVKIRVDGYDNVGVKGSYHVIVNVSKTTEE